MWTWEWDETLYTGSAPHYDKGRMPYPPAVASALRDTLGLDGTGRLLDVGCGPGSLTRLLAPLFAATVGVDADPSMIEQAASSAGGSAPIQWRCMRAEALPADLGTFRAVTFAQSFHWMDQPLVADRVRGMLAPGGAWVHVQANTHRGDPVSPAEPLWQEIDALVTRYLGPVRRAGRTTLPTGTRGGEEDVMRAAGYTGPTRIEIPGGDLVTRTSDEVVSAVLSLSSSTPHLFGDRLPAFESDLRTLLPPTVTTRTHQIALVIWHPQDQRIG